jgi:branched-chain amino acid transport system permease protein
VTLTFGITGIVNFALGEFMMIGAYVTWYLFDVAGLPYPVAIFPAIAIAAGCGFAADQLLFRFTRNNLINGLLVSIGLISIIEAAALLLWTTTPKDMGYVLSGAVRLGGVSVPKMKLVVFALLAAVMFLTYAALSRTWIGRAAYAYSQNPEAAMLMGVRTEALQSAVVVYSTALAGFGGALYASLYSLEPAMGGLYILKGIEAAILGGIGSLIGSLAGGIILGVTEAVGSIYLPSAFRDAYGLIFVVAILLYQPSGLFGGER